GNGAVTSNNFGAPLIIDKSPTTSGGTATFTGAITGNLSIEKYGAGTQILAPGLYGANTYNRGTDVNEGTLLVNNTVGSGTGTGDVSVSSGATLGGSGSIDGNTTISSGGHLAPGSGPGNV